MSQVKIFVSFFFGISIVEAIIGGESVLNPHEFPWMVGVRTKSGKCGGSVITKNLVMTAAHCIFNSKTQELISCSRHRKTKFTNSESPIFFVD